MVEADSFGGDLAYRCRHAGLPLPESPNVLTATAAVRHGAVDEVLARYSHGLTDTVRVVPGHLSAEQSFNTDWRPLADALATSRSRVIVDLGRLHSASPTVALAAKADAVLPVFRADVTSVMRTLDLVERLVPELASCRDAVPTLVPVVIVARRHASGVVREVSELLSGSRVAPAVGSVAWIAHDDDAADAIYGGRMGHRTRLGQSARRVWSHLADGASSSESAVLPGRGGAAHAEA